MGHVIVPDRPSGFNDGSEIVFSCHMIHNTKYIRAKYLSKKAREHGLQTGPGGHVLVSWRDHPVVLQNISESLTIDFSLSIKQLSGSTRTKS